MSTIDCPLAPVLDGPAATDWDLDRERAEGDLSSVEDVSARSKAENTRDPETGPNSPPTILLVDDDPLVRDIAAQILTDLGYHVIEAEGGEEAIAAFENHSGQIDLLLSDVIMPVMHGRALYENLRERDPDLRILYMSGYTDEILGQDGILEEGTDLLPKPFSLDMLAQRVQRAIARE